MFNLWITEHLFSKYGKRINNFCHNYIICLGYFISNFSHSNWYIYLNAILFYIFLMLCKASFQMFCLFLLDCLSFYSVFVYIWQEHLTQFSLFQFSPVIQLYLTLCDPMNCSTPDHPVHHWHLEFTQTHVQWVGDDI